MSGLLLLSVTHKPYRVPPCDWIRQVSVFDVEGARKIPEAMPGWRLDSFDADKAAMDEDAEYVGVTTYRRYPVFLDQHRITQPKLFAEPKQDILDYLASPDQRDAALRLLASHDVIQFRPWYLSYCNQEQFCLYLPAEAWEILMGVLDHLGMGASLGDCETNNAHVWCNLFIARRDVFCRYAEFVFRAAAMLVSDGRFRAMAEANKRLLPMCLERIAPLYALHYRLRSAFVPLLTLEEGA